MTERGSGVTVAASLDELDRAYDEQVAEAARSIRAFVSDSGSVQLAEVVVWAVKEFDPALVRDALSYLVYDGDVVLTEDRRLTPQG